MTQAQETPLEVAYEQKVRECKILLNRIAELESRTWTSDECDRAIRALHYIEGIVVIGEGRQMLEGETLESFVLNYIQKLKYQLVERNARIEALEWENKGIAKVQEQLAAREAEVAMLRKEVLN